MMMGRLDDEEGTVSGVGVELDDEEEGDVGDEVELEDAVAVEVDEGEEDEDAALICLILNPCENPSKSVLDAVNPGLFLLCSQAI